jgi:hypothetical protein
MEIVHSSEMSLNFNLITRPLSQSVQDDSNSVVYNFQIGKWKVKLLTKYGNVTQKVLLRTN